MQRFFILFTVLILFLGSVAFAKENKIKIPYNNNLTKIECTQEVDSLGLNDKLTFYIDDKNKKILYNNAKEYMYYDIENYNDTKKYITRFDEKFIELRYIQTTDNIYEDRFILNRVNGDYIHFSTTLNNKNDNLRYSIGYCSVAR